jgi:hypothetical protein
MEGLRDLKRWRKWRGRSGCDSALQFRKAASH